MRSLIRFIIRKILARTSGKSKYQKSFSTLRDIAIKGMNYGAGDHKTSGELYVLERIALGLGPAIENLTAFDVGANIGEYSVEISKAFPHAKIYSFEPSKSTFKSLVKTTSLVKNIQVHNFGFSDTKGELVLHFDTENSALASVYGRDLSDHNIHLNQVEQIQVSTIDHFCQENAIDKIHFLKIDVEGHEVDVLKGANNMLANHHIDIIQFEFGEACIDAKTYLRDFYAILPNYDFYRIVKDGMFALGEYKTENEIFKTINLLAFRKGLEKEYGTQFLP